MRAPQNGHEREQNERGQNERRYKMGMSVGRMSVCRMQHKRCRMSACRMVWVFLKNGFTDDEVEGLNIRSRRFAPPRAAACRGAAPLGKLRPCRELLGHVVADALEHVVPPDMTMFW